MTDNKREDIEWNLLWLGLLGAIPPLPALISGNDFTAFLAILLLVALVGLALLIVVFLRIRRQTIAALLMLALSLCLSMTLFRASFYLHTAARWLAVSGEYKTRVLDQPNPADGTFKYTEWESWGFTGVGDTTEYLVFDPSDQLHTATESHLPAKFNGIPCTIVRAQRLERNWYTVRFYTDQDWKFCG